MAAAGRSAPARVLIGARLRAARQARGLTVESVADSAGLTKSFISRLERDQVSPSVASLVRVCEVLGLAVGALFEAPSTSLVRAAAGKPINFGGARVHEFLLTPGTQDRLQVIHAFIEPGGTGGDDLYALSCDVEFAYVISGRLEITVTNEVVELLAGDAFTFPGRELHTWRNASQKRPCEALWVLAPAP